MTGRPAFGARWPWLTRRRCAVLAALMLGAAVAIPWQHAAREREFLAQLDAALPMSVALSADALGDWAAMHATQARTLATLAARTAPRGGAAGTLGDVLPAVARAGGYREARIDRLPERRPFASSPEALAPATHGTMTYAEFGAPVGDSAEAIERVVLTVALTEASLSHFNIAARDDRTQRTVLLRRPTTFGPDARADRAPSPDTLQLLVVSAPGGASPPATTSLAQGITAASLARAHYATAKAIRERPHGIARGITGAEVVYAAAAVPGTPWMLVRERETGELLDRIAPALLITDAVWTVLTALVLLVLTLRWRAQHQRQEMESVRLRSTFVASVSHELRTPLTQVRMYAEMLRLGLLDAPADRDRALSVIEKEAERLGQLIERALTFVRTGQAPAPATEDPVVLREAVRRAVDAITPLAAERAVSLQHDVPANLTVRIARDDLHQVLLNLIDNAIKYGPTGQIVRLDARGDRTRVTLTVRDHGPGVPVAERATIFEPYRRGQAAASGTASGTGIGLVVVRALVERVGGQVRIEDPPHADGERAAGVVFVVELPSGV